MLMRSTASTDPLLGSRLHIAIKAALAAALAWQIGNLLPSPMGDYAYYAPMGAVLAVHPSVAGSLRGSLQLFVALLVGAAVGATFHLLPLPGWAGIGLLVLIAVILAGWDRLGAERSWVITAALFTYILGNLDTSDFVLGLVGQVSLGAVVGLALTLLLPPIPARVARRRLDAVSTEVAEQLEGMAVVLRGQTDDPASAWLEVAREVLPDALRLRESYSDLDDALRGNLRAGRWRELVGRRRSEADVIERVAALVENLTYMLGEVQESPRPWLRIGGDAAQTVADVLDELASVVRRLVGDEPLQARDTEPLVQGVERLSALVRETVGLGEESFPGAAVVVSLRRILGVLPMPESDAIAPPITPLRDPSWPPRVGRRRRR
ncbi:FUSC family protein [Mumia sp. DW29H23]|uniref:FUSC family protein n=1 Tax=Mumia sp. DW29H23 TaxID=3421241 RepID=UPI003D68E8BA